MSLYLFVTVYENNIPLLKSGVVGIRESGNFKDLLEAALLKELFLEEKIIKIDLQSNESSIWHPVLNGLNESLESCSRLKAQHIRFIIESQDSQDDISNPNEEISALDLMMTQRCVKKTSITL